MNFNPNEHMRKIKSRDGEQDYLDVKWRLVWFREKYPHGSIVTEELAFDLDREVEAEGFVWNPETRRSERVIKKARGYARYRAIVEDGEGGRATGTKSENAANFPDFGEKAETGAIGRALAGLGFGTQYAPDLNEGERLVDSPVDRAPTASEKSPEKPVAASVSGQAPRGTPPVSEQGVRTRLRLLYNRAKEKCLIDNEMAPDAFIAYIAEALDVSISRVSDIQEPHLQAAEAYIEAA